MHTHPASRRVLAAVLLAGAFPLLSAAAAPVPSAPDADAAVNPAEKVRQGLDRVVSIRFDRQMMPEALAELGDKAKLHIVLDGPAAQQFGIAPGQLQVPVQADLNGVKARTAVRTLLDPYNLTFVTVGGEVVVATQDGAVGRQIEPARQRPSGQNRLRRRPETDRPRNRRQPRAGPARRRRRRPR